MRSPPARPIREAQPLDWSRSRDHIARMARSRLSAPPVAPGATGYVGAVLLVALSSTAGLLLAPRWGNSAVDLLYLPAVLAAGVFAGLGPAILAAILSAAAYNYLFTAPYHTFRIHSPADIVTVVVLFLVALVTSQLAASLRKEAQLAQAHAARNATIAGLARRLLSCTSELEVAKVGVDEIGELFGANTVLLAGHPAPQLIAARPSTIALNPSDTGMAAAVLESGQAMGRGLNRVSTVEWQFRPVSSDDRIIAVVGLARDDGVPPVGDGQSPLLQSLLDQIAHALERTRLEEEARGFEALRERDRLRAALLASIGQDIRPRLTAIGEAVSGLRRGGTADKALVSAIQAETGQLDRYLSNLIELEPESEQKPIHAGGVTIDLFQRTISRDGRDVHLTPKEYAVLAELAKHPGRVLSHEHLLRTAWGPAQERQTEYLRVAVRALRQKLERNPARPELILNEPAVGYRLMAG